jgi:hypothetical protein
LKDLEKFEQGWTNKATTRHKLLMNLLGSSNMWRLVPSLKFLLEIVGRDGYHPTILGTANAATNHPTNDHGETPSFDMSSLVATKNDGKNNHQMLRLQCQTNEPKYGLVWNYGAKL